MKEKRMLNQRKKKQMVFFYSLMILPILQFCIFYIYANSNMIFLAFQNYKVKTDALGYDITFAGFENFKTALTYLKEHSYMVWNALEAFLLVTLLEMVIAILFSYYIYKRYPMHGFFRIVLFMPKIISGVVFVILFKYIVTDVYIYVMEKFANQDVLGLLDNPETKKATVFFYCIYMGFGVNVLLFCGAMSGINDSIVESAQLDGSNTLQEFWYITLPMIFPTIKSLLIVGISGIFTQQLALHTFFAGDAAELSTIGYTIYLQSTSSGVVAPNNRVLNFSQLSAMGVMFSIVLYALLTIVRKALNKYGPSVD